MIKRHTLLLTLLFTVCLLFSSVVYSEQDTSSSIPTSSEDAAVAEPNPLSQADHDAALASAENFEFQAEVTRLMDIIINSLYTKREIFIREIISNAADALDKVRFLQLSNQTDTLDNDKYEIRIAFDKEARTLSITDTGVGMTKDDLKKNLGIVAKSGTSDFLDAAAKGGDALSLIGQFGVGFYSVYLVADRVTVISKHHSADSDQYIWESAADRTFTIAKDPRGNTLRRGTQIILHMKPDADEFLSEHEIRKLIARYSEFIDYPILLHVSEMVDKEPETTATTPSDDEEVVVSEEEEAVPSDTHFKEKVQVWKWERINDLKAIWTRNPADINPEEYQDFYKSLTKDEGGALKYIHFKAEGEIAFRSILFIPKTAPAGLYDKMNEKSKALKLYVRRVLISDEFEDFLPRYLNFVRGVVDSEDLPLNVNRETLSQSRVLRVMSKKITRKVIEMINKLSEADKKKRSDKSEDSTSEDSTDSTDSTDYQTFWSNYGKSIKLGIVDNDSSKSKLSKLLRYVTSKSDGQFISLDEYVDRMKENQKHIYFVTGENVETLKKSPFVEKLLKKDLEVVYMTDPIDEYLLQSMTEYDGTQFMSVTREGLKIDDNEEARLAKYKEEFTDLTSWMQTALGDKVTKVTIGNRVLHSPMVIVTGQYGWSANMERIMSSQAFANNRDVSHLKSRKTLELNPLHPIIRELKARVATNPDDEQLKDMVVLMWDAALLQSGFSMEEPDQFASRVHKLVGEGLKVDPNAIIEEDEDIPSSSTSSSSNDDEVIHEEL